MWDFASDKNKENAERTRTSYYYWYRCYCSYHLRSDINLLHTFRKNSFTVTLITSNLSGRHKGALPHGITPVYALRGCAHCVKGVTTKVTPFICSCLANTAPTRRLLCVLRLKRDQPGIHHFLQAHENADFGVVPGQTALEIHGVGGTDGAVGA